MGHHAVTDDAAWNAIAADLPRTWEFYDAHGAWFGRDRATSVDDAVRVVALWLEDDARFRFLPPHTTTVILRCLATDERARTTITINIDHDHDQPPSIDSHR